MSNVQIAILLAIVWTVAVFILSTSANVQAPKMPNLVFSFDKWAHMGSYALLCGLWMYVLYARNQFTRRMLLLCGLVCIAYGALMEYIQYSFYPNRYFELGDMLANSLGVLIALAIGIWLKKKRDIV